MQKLHTMLHLKPSCSPKPLQICIFICLFLVLGIYSNVLGQSDTIQQSENQEEDQIEDQIENQIENSNQTHQSNDTNDTNNTNNSNNDSNTSDTNHSSQENQTPDTTNESAPSYPENSENEPSSEPSEEEKANVEEEEEEYEFGYYPTAPPPVNDDEYIFTDFRDDAVPPTQTPVAEKEDTIEPLDHTQYQRWYYKQALSKKYLTNKRRGSFMFGQVGLILTIFAGNFFKEGNFLGGGYIPTPLAVNETIIFTSAISGITLAFLGGACFNANRKLIKKWQEWNRIDQLIIDFPGLFYDEEMEKGKIKKQMGVSMMIGAAAGIAPFSISLYRSTSHWNADEEVNTSNDWYYSSLSDNTLTFGSLTSKIMPAWIGLNSVLLAYLGVRSIRAGKQQQHQVLFLKNVPPNTFDGDFSHIHRNSMLMDAQFKIRLGVTCLIAGGAGLPLTATTLLSAISITPELPPIPIPANYNTEEEYDIALTENNFIYSKVLNSYILLYGLSIIETSCIAIGLKSLIVGIRDKKRAEKYGYSHPEISEPTIVFNPYIYTNILAKHFIGGITVHY